MSETEDELPAPQCARCQMETPVACVWLKESDCLLGLKKRFESKPATEEPHERR
jgi:hypothetical protein